MIDRNTAPEFGRRETILKALERLEAICPEGPRIVETGTLRDGSDNARGGDGWSTVAWGWHCARTGGRAVTVDVNSDALEVCRQITAPYAGSIEYVASDSAAFLQSWSIEERGRIDLLYLDSLDYHDHAASEAHHCTEAEAALPALAEHCLVLIDDTSPSGEEDGVPTFGGKGARAIPFLLEHGFRVEWAESGQVLLERRAADG